MQGHDVVVAGAGHNGLAAAAYLAKAGLSCLVIEAEDRIGGDTATDELTLPGFRHDTCSTAHNIIQASPLLRNDELGLGSYGLEYVRPDPVVHFPLPDGTSVTMWRELEQTVSSIARLSPADASTYRRMMEEYDEVKQLFGAARYTPIGLGPDLDTRLREHPAGRRWRRRVLESAWDVIRREYEHRAVRAVMAWMAFMTMQPPQRPGTGALAYSLAFGRQRESWVLPRGGSAALPDALARFVEDRGGTILTGRRVTELVVESGRCVAVRDDAGETHRARRAVLSSIHPKHLVAMAEETSWGEDFVKGIEEWRAGISMFAAHYATTEAPTFETPEGTITPVAAGAPHSVERMLRIDLDFALRRVALDDPPLLVLCPTVADPTRAPEGHHTLKIVGFQPYELGEGAERWDEIRDGVAEANFEHLRRYAPGLTADKVLAEAVKSPLDLERMNAHNWHGSCHGGDQDPAQSGAMRPVPGWATHRMPIPGLYQTGSTTHPGASVSAGPGRNAAWVMLDDLGIDRRSIFAPMR